MLVSVIIVSWNTKDLLRDCLSSVFAETKENEVEVFVVDNDSPDDSAEMVAREFPEVQLIANNDNRGFAPANNQALAQARGDYFLLLNPDTRVIDGAIDKMVAFSEKKQQGGERLGVVTCKLLNADKTLQPSVNRFYSFWRSFVENRFTSDILQKLKIDSTKLPTSWNHDSEREIDWAHGAVMLFSREVLETVGPLDDRFYIYAEEIDFYFRVKKAGFHSFFTPDIEILHYGRQSSRQRRAAMFIQNYRSFYLLLSKHYSRLDYWLYRSRAQVYLLGWYVFFTLRRDDESRALRQVYGKTIRWHFSRDSFRYAP